MLPLAAGFFVVAVFSSFFSSSPYLSFSYFFTLFPAFLIFVLTYQVCSEQTNRVIALGIILTGTLLCAGAGINMFNMTHPIYGTPMYSTFYQADAFAAYLLLFLPFFVISLLYINVSVLFYISAAATYLTGLCLLLSFSRAAWISMGLILILWIILNFRNFKGRLYRLITLAVIIAAIFVTASYLTQKKVSLQVPEKIKTRAENLISGNDNSVTARISFWKSTIKIIQKSPVTGIGFELFSRYYPMYQTDQRYFGKYAHSSLLEFWCETGSLGLIFLLGFIVWGLILLFRKWAFPRQPEYWYIYQGLLLGVVAVLIHSSVDMDFKYPAILAGFFAVLGLLFSELQAGDQPPEYSPSPRFLRLSGIILLLLIPVSGSDFISQKYLEQSQTQREQGNARLAYDYLIKAERFNPINPEIYYQKADLDFMKFINSNRPADLESAFINADKVIDLDRHKAFAYYFLAQILKFKSPGAEYIKAMNKAIQLDPINFPVFYNDLSAYYYQKGDRKQALAILQKILNVYQNIPLEEFLFFRRDYFRQQLGASFNLLGNILLDQQNFTDAQKAYEKSIFYNSEAPAPYFALGILAFKAGKYQQAIVFFDKCLNLDANYAPGWLLLGAAWGKMGIPAKAEIYAQKARILDPKLNETELLKRFKVINGK